MDMVYIYDEIGLLEVCTGSQCSNHKSRGNTLVVYFESDHVTVDIGFKAQLIAINADPCYCPEVTEVLLTSPDQSFNLESPKYPQSYCANHHCAWHISATQDLLIRINWKTFDLGNGDTFDIDLGVEGLSSCINRDCEDLQTSEKELFLEFSSNDQVSSDGNTFFALVTAVHSYCMAINVPIGNVSYDRESRLDGNLTNRTVSTLVCPSGYKISDSLHDTNSTNICVAPDWNQRLKTCVQVCKVDSTFSSLSHTNICAYADDVHTDLVAVGDELLVKEYDILAGTMHSEQVFVCSESGWTPQTPTCHRIAILMYGDIEQGADTPTEKRLLLYYPLEHRVDVLEFMLEPLDVLPPFRAGTLDDGRVLVSGLLIDSSLIDLSSGTLTKAKNPLVPRGMAASAQLAGEVIVCGGEGNSKLRNCEVWRNNRWMPLNANMNVPRQQFTMVGTQDTLYAIGGMGASWSALGSVEKYLPQTNQWQLVSELPDFRAYGSGAVHYDGVILFCGGIESKSYMSTNRCYKYVISNDTWEGIASMHDKRAYFPMVVVAGRIYALGGLYSGIHMNDVPVLSVEIYDYHQDQWSIQGDLPSIITKAISPSTIVAVSWENKALTNF